MNNGFFFKDIEYIGFLFDTLNVNQWNKKKSSRNISMGNLHKNDIQYRIEQKIKKKKNRVFVVMN